MASARAAQANTATAGQTPTVDDLDAIEERGTSRILVAKTGERFLPREGMPQSYERNRLQDFANAEGVTAQIVLVSGFDQLFPMLEAGRVT